VISFDWKNQYSVGIKSLDQQHRAIMAGLNEVHEEMLNGKANDALAPRINRLFSLAQEHFSFEERLMESTQFPGLAGHRTLHQAICTKVGEFISRHDTGDRAAYGQFMYVMRDSMIKHMKTDDQECASWLAAHGMRSQETSDKVDCVNEHSGDRAALATMDRGASLAADMQEYRPNSVRARLEASHKRRSETASFLGRGTSRLSTGEYQGATSALP
jgi:hemerythrin-like metal-binding protein